MWRDCILVAVGANLVGPGGRAPLDTCEWAVGRVAALPGLRLVARSRWFQTRSEPPGQPDYVNGVVRLAGEAEPRALLAALHGIEAEAGRERGERWGPRTLDLDLVGVDDAVVGDSATEDGTLVLPHPRMHRRTFVLLPACDVAPEWRHPVLGRTALKLLRDCADAGAAKALPPRPGLPM